jgi:IclR family mhp operon transcriptional activator
VLEAVNRLGPCRLNELEADQAISRATLIRMLETLMAAGYVERLAERGLYVVTLQSRKLSSGLSLPSDIARRAAPVLAKLQHIAGWPCDVAVYDGMEMVTIANSPQEGRLSFNRPVGWTAPVLATSLGLAYIAFSTEAEQSSILSRLVTQPGEWNRIAHDFAAASALFKAIRANGYATIDSNWAKTSGQPNVRTIGVPVLVNGRAVAAMNFVFIRQALELDQAVKTLLDPLKKAANDLALEIAEFF